MKQGLYVLGDSYDKYYSREVLSGMIYGPSAISLEYALSYHGLIPERVEELTCICFKKEKRFNTPVGRFSYKYISSEKYTCGIKYHKTDLGNFFMATPEKALCDKVYFSVLNKEQDMSSYLLDELRIDRDQLRKLDLIEIERLASIYKRKTCHYLVETISRLQNEED
ncbi:hypothetical protein [Oceanispirochaeta sp.]|uniref:type IV toxin-antitoxin system AbiEi family antitoxin domain-containing protein n=1 Tax=Oceanispirochaeta sp. TaxID=2035350 RepID=UPI00260E3DFA|nr:hypothetical protein [Oceanispirochaeta sp.]MDA3957803.1 hypothetical protein [Oceanispirochaeta sp.]